METPKISVIVAVYKAEAYLHRCLDSLLAQTFRDFEILLVDDGSPDKSGEICDEYAEKDVRIRVFHKENGGVGSARQCGIDHAKRIYHACGPGRLGGANHVGRFVHQGERGGCGYGD